MRASTSFAVGARRSAAVGREQRQRLPDRLDELEVRLRLATGGVGREPEAELLGMHDRRVGERGIGVLACVAVARHSGDRVADEAARQPVAARTDAARRQLYGARVVAVGASQQVRNAEALGQCGPRGELPGSGEVTADDEDVRHEEYRSDGPTGGAPRHCFRQDPRR